MNLPIYIFFVQMDSFRIEDFLLDDPTDDLLLQLPSSGPTVVNPSHPVVISDPIKKYEEMAPHFYESDAEISGLFNFVLNPSDESFFDGSMILSAPEEETSNNLAIVKDSEPYVSGSYFKSDVSFVRVT